MLAPILALLLIVWLAAAVVGGEFPFGGGDGERAANSGLPDGWVSLEPLLPLAPGLKEMSALKRSAAGGASAVLGASAESDDGALRLRALPRTTPDAAGTTGALASVPGAGGGPVPLPSGVLAAADRIVDARAIVRRPPTLGDLDAIVDRDLNGLPGGGLGGADIDIPPIDPLPNGSPRPQIPPIGFPGVDSLPGVGDPLPGVDPLPGAGSLGANPIPSPPINLTVGDLRADSRFDVLLVSSGRSVLERYVFSDGDIAGLSAQVNLRSGLLTADPLRDRAPLSPVLAVPLSAGGGEAGASASGSGTGTSQGPAGAGGGIAGGKAGAPSSRDRGNRSGARGRRTGGGSSAGTSSGGGSSSESPNRARGGSSATRPSRGRGRKSGASRRGAAPGNGRPRGGDSRRGGGSPSPGSSHGGGPRGRGQGHGQGKGHDKGHDDDHGHHRGGGGDDD